MKDVCGCYDPNDGSPETRQDCKKEIREKDEEADYEEEVE